MNLGKYDREIAQVFFLLTFILFFGFIVFVISSSEAETEQSDDSRINELLRLYRQLERRKPLTNDGHSLAALIQAQMDIMAELRHENYRSDFEFATRKR